MFARAWVVRLAVAAALLGAPLAASPAMAAGVSVAIGSAPFVVSPGGEFDLDVRVTDAQSSFNGFDAVISYDPAALTFMPASPLSAQQGCLMTGSCSAACGNTFHLFSAAGDSLRITDVLLCNQASVTGPGQVYRLHFKASNTQQITPVRFRRAGFYDAGVRIAPVTTTNLDVAIAVGAGVGGPGAITDGLTLHSSPEPARGPLRFVIGAGRPGAQTLAVHDVTGRRVRLLASGWQPAGERSLTWDGRDDSGAALPAGVYLATLRAGGSVVGTRITLLR